MDDKPLITYATGKQIRWACLNFHYAKSTPPHSFAYSVYQGFNWCGVIIYGPGATPRIGEPFGLQQNEVAELVRVALNVEQHTTSECVAASMRQLHKDAPGIRLVVSFADIDQHHAGTIYQATNWIYLGQRNEGDLTAFIVNGKKTHRRTIGSMGGIQNIGWVREHLDPAAQEFRTAGKHKYVFAFDKRLRRELLKQAQPYPKRGNHEQDHQPPMEERTPPEGLPRPVQGDGRPLWDMPGGFGADTL